MSYVSSVIQTSRNEVSKFVINMKIYREIA